MSRFRDFEGGETRRNMSDVQPECPGRLRDGLLVCSCSCRIGGLLPCSELVPTNIAHDCPFDTTINTLVVVVVGM